jgi:hypothetical protein
MTLRYKFRRFLTEKIGLFLPFSNRKDRKRVLLVTEQGEIAGAQIYPFFLYERDLARDYAIEVRELPLKMLLNGKHRYKTHIDAVCVQTWFTLRPAQLESLIERIKSAWPEAGIAYFDWFAPADLRYAEVLNPHILAYVKKQIFRDFKEYDRAVVGDTNMTDYYAKRFQIDLPQTKFSIPPGFEQKIILGSGFEYSPPMVRNLNRAPNLGERTIDLHARVEAKGVHWYEKMRQEAWTEAAKLDGRFRIAYRGRVSRRQYFEELASSKLCFSPFGYGEVCWRDFEAMSTGALLLKPDMSHLRLVGDFFRPYETYIPLSWDLSDLADKVAHYIHHDSERESIARNAFEFLRDRYRQKEFLQEIVPLWRSLCVY